MSSDAIRSISVAGENHYLLSSKVQYWRPGSFAAGIKEDEIQLYVVFGTNGSWYRCSKQKNGKTYIATSANFRTEYPNFLQILEKHKDYSKPKQLSLGPTGRFFANMASGRFRQAPKKMEQAFGKVGDYRYMWFGKGNSYVAVKSDGSCSYDLDGKYGKLEEHLKTYGRPTVLALDIEGDAEYIAIWPGGKCSWLTREKDIRGENIRAFLATHGYNQRSSS